MTRTTLTVLALILLSGIAHGAEPAVPTGQLPDTFKPTAYRLDLTVDPAQQDFTGHTEIDAVLSRPARSFFLHGKDLKVSAARVTVAGKTQAVRYTEVDDSGVARIDVPAELPAGKLTLSFDYTAAFRTGAEGLFRAEVAGSGTRGRSSSRSTAAACFPASMSPASRRRSRSSSRAPKPPARVREHARDARDAAMAR